MDDVKFGTDGIRGIFRATILPETFYKIGKILAKGKVNKNLIVACDTRESGQLLKFAVMSGALYGGMNIVDIGIASTPALAYITKNYGAKFGIMITASHNPREYNGIKIFNNNGYKISKKQEKLIENRLKLNKISKHKNIRKYILNKKSINSYKKFLIENFSLDLHNFKIGIDASNGANYYLAPKILKSLNANLIKINCKNDGKKINKECGAVYPESMQQIVIEKKLDIGFCFDGDADRLIVIDDNGKILDGDNIMYIIANYLQDCNELISKYIVLTYESNMALQLELNKIGINCLYSDIGDKNVVKKMIKNNIKFGGEKSGHFILKNFSTTGDGLLTALLLLKILILKNCKLSELKTLKFMPRVSDKVVVKDKLKIMNNEKIKLFTNKIKKEIREKGKLLFRPSGTEPCIRILVEHPDLKVCKKYVKNIKNLIKSI